MGERPSFSSLRLASVLVVDDTPINLITLEVILRAAGCEVVRAATAAEALEKLKLRVPDLILLDVVLPDIEGYDLCRTIHGMPECRDLPIIFISARTEADDKVRGFEVGGADYVTKPFQALEVLARVEHQIKIARLTRELQREKEQLLAKNQELLRAQNEIAASFGALTEALPGQNLDNRYRLDQKIGSGGFGVVYRSTQLGLQRQVAVKIFRPQSGKRDPESIRRFVQEGISACRVNHPNAVLILDAGISQQGIPYLVMELLRGHPLSEELRQHRKLSLARTLRIMLPVLRVLIEAHQVGVVHRDIKPDNIFLHYTRDERIVKVLDFGIAKLVETTAASPNKPKMTLTRPEGLLGTPANMSPERVKSLDCDGRADVYSVGVMMFEMLTGRLPWRSEGGGSLAVLIDHLHREPALLRTYEPASPAVIETLIQSALTKSAERRPTAQEFLNTLERVIAEDGELQAALKQAASDEFMGPERTWPSSGVIAIPADTPASTGNMETIEMDEKTQKVESAEGNS
ncbi:MAG: protein kinase [Polyangia bacterium]